MNRGRGGGGRGNPGFRGGRGGRGGATGPRPQQQFPGKTSTTPDSVPMDLVRPVLPPTFPEYAEGAYYDFPEVAILHFANTFPVINDYLHANFSINYRQDVSSGFEFQKYTDKYEQPFRELPHLHHLLDKRFFPKELYTKANKQKRPPRVVDTTQILEKYTIKEEKHDSDSDEDESKSKTRKNDPLNEDTEELKNAAKSLAADLGDGDDEDDDEADEEMDEGNDYMNDYFDNGEGYMSEDEALEDGDVF